MEAPTQFASPDSGFTLWLTGLSGAGKSTLGERIAADLQLQGRRVELLDGDRIRERLSAGLGFSREDRDTNVNRIGFVANLLRRNGVCVIVAAISPYREARLSVRASHDPGRFVEVHVDCPLATAIERDVKGLYWKAMRGVIPNFTGISDPYETPYDPEITVHTNQESIDESCGRIMSWLAAHGYAAELAHAFSGDLRSESDSTAHRKPYSS